MSRVRISRPARFVAALLFIGLMSACARPTPAPVPVSTPAPAATRIPDTPAPTATDIPATPVPTATPTQPPAATALPEEVATVPPTATAAPAPTATPSPAPRLDALRLGLAPIAQNLAAPVFVTHAGDGRGRLFLVEKVGRIRIFDADGLRPVPFLDIRDRVRSDGMEQGLLGLAFAPDFSDSGRFFVDYTDRDGNTVIARFTAAADGETADPAGESRVLSIDQPAANHNGGMLVFGPDGYLWVGTGDGGMANDRFGNGQNPDTLLGKMLRLDVTSDPAAPYLIPGDNPWVDAGWDGRDVRDEVWAVGLRNPWRYSFDRATGDLWIADVGQNLYEEVNFVPAGSPGGLNFGWPIMEGTHCFPESAGCQRAGLEIPVAEYRHGADGCSITGGYVYRGAAFPALAGVYLYSDYCSGKIWGLARDGDGWRNHLLLESRLNVSSFGEDEAGELYVTDLQGGVYRIVVE